MVMVKEREEILTYYIGMPHVFETWSGANIEDDIRVLSVLKEKSFQFTNPKAGSGKGVCVDGKGNFFSVKYTNETEKNLYTEVLPTIRKQNLPFKVLQFPELEDTVEVNSEQDGQRTKRILIFTKHITGTNFNNTWDEISTIGSGGRGIQSEFANKVVDLVEDLSLVKYSSLAEFDLSTFDFEKWKSKNLPFISEILIKRGLITQDYIDKASSILSSTSLFVSSRMIITNGDFYPRNLIERPNGKIVVIDWEGRKDYDIDGLVDQRNAFFNYIENHVAFFLIHMWGNDSFQRNLMKNATQRFGLIAENMQAAILIKSLEQSVIWPDDVARHQIEIFIKALDINSVKDLMIQ